MPLIIIRQEYLPSPWWITFLSSMLSVIIGVSLATFVTWLQQETEKQKRRIQVRSDLSGFRELLSRVYHIKGRHDTSYYFFYLTKETLSPTDPNYNVIQQQIYEKSKYSSKYIILLAEHHSMLLSYLALVRILFKATKYREILIDILITSQEDFYEGVIDLIKSNMEKERDVKEAERLEIIRMYTYVDGNINLPLQRLLDDIRPEATLSLWEIFRSRFHH